MAEEMGVGTGDGINDTAGLDVGPSVGSDEGPGLTKGLADEVDGLAEELTELEERRSEGG